MLQPIHFSKNLFEIFPELYVDCSIDCLPFFLRLSRNRSTINATTNTFLERSFRDLSNNVWVVALIVYRFRDTRKKHSFLVFYEINAKNGTERNETETILLKWGRSSIVLLFFSTLRMETTQDQSPTTG